MSKRIIEVKSKIYDLRTKEGVWLGRVILTNDGAFMSITNYGNFNFGWFDVKEDFREFLIGVEEEYFSRKIAIGVGCVCNDDLKRTY